MMLRANKNPQKSQGVYKSNKACKMFNDFAGKEFPVFARKKTTVLCTPTKNPYEIKYCEKSAPNRKSVFY
jgi:hypothetical protein